MPWSQLPPATPQPSPPGGTASSGPSFRPTVTRFSMSSVARALARRGLLLPQRYQAERRQLARARRAVFLEPPTRRCRVWQSDFSEFETIGGGIWRLCGVVDYVAKVSLACPVTTTQTAVDAIAALEAARLN